MKYYLEVLKKYATFSGRARRAEYWQFAGIQIAILIPLSILMETNENLSVFYIIYALATFLPGLAVTVRRLHDVGKSEWYILLNLIPIVGIWVLILLCKNGEPGMNKYGMNPKEIQNSWK